MNYTVSGEYDKYKDIQDPLKKPIDVTPDALNQPILSDKPSLLAPSKQVYAYLALFIIVLIRIAIDWQNKSLGYFYGYTHLLADPKFEIARAYPLLNQYYGLLVGPAHTIPTAVFSLVAGALS